MPPRLSKTPLAAGAALLALVAAACSGSSDAGHASSPTSSTSVVGSSTAPAGVNNSPFVWARQTDPALSLGGGPTATISGVLPPSQGSQMWTLAGSQELTGGVTVPVVWTSTNATTWAASRLPASSTPSSAASAADWRTSTVVVGSVGVGNQQRAAAWVASAGGPYVSVPVLGSPAPSTMGDVTAGPLGLFAIGSAGGKPAMWSSTNGLRWTLDDQFANLIVGSVDPVVDTVFAYNTTVYAAGSVVNGTETDAALWASGDGINWRRVSQAEAAFGGPGARVITGLGSLGNGLVAAGGIRTGSEWSPASWISPDGVSWSQPSEDFPMGSRPQEGPGGSIVRSISSLAVLPGTTAQLMAVGGSGSAQRAWQSNNGVTWSEVTLPAGPAESSDWHATLVGTTGATTVIADGEPGRPYVLAEGPGGWSEPSSDPRVFGAVQTVATPAAAQATGSRFSLAVDLFTPPQTIGGRASRTTEVLSTNGSAWTAGADASSAVLPPSRPAGATDTVRFAGDWVAVGEAEPAAAPAGAVNPTGLAESWTSIDGVHWIPRGPLDTAAGVGPEQPTGLCVQSGPNPRVIAVGWSYQATAGQVALAWVSADGAHWSRALVEPSALPAGAQEISGCVATSSGPVAYGATTAGSGATIPAIWRSTDGSAWTREATPTFVPASTAEVTSLANAGSTWIAVVSDSGWTGRTTPAGTDESAATSQLWVSEDGGVTWLSLDTSGPPWQSGDAAELVLAAFAGDRPVLAGVVAGQLAVWVGSPATQPLSSSAST